MLRLSLLNNVSCSTGGGRFLPILFQLWLFQRNEWKLINLFDVYTVVMWLTMGTARSVFGIVIQQYYTVTFGLGIKIPLRIFSLLPKFHWAPHWLCLFMNDFSWWIVFSCKPIHDSRVTSYRVLSKYAQVAFRCSWGEYYTVTSVYWQLHSELIVQVW